ncbi:MAG: flagellar FlbD family protein [Vicinamibacteria bacterium]
MIHVTRLDGSSLVVNADLIERIEAVPDTLVVFSNGESLVVRETPEVLVDRAIAFRRQVAGTAHGLHIAGAPAAGSRA